MQVKELRPRFFIYCQNERMTTFTGFEALLKHGGEVLHLPNVGRETHGYLQYILAHYDRLPDHVLFSQDLPEPMLMARFQVSCISVTALSGRAVTSAG